MMNWGEISILFGAITFNVLQEILSALNLRYLFKLCL